MGVHMDLGAISVWLGFIMQDVFFPLEWTDF